MAEANTAGMNHIDTIYLEGTAEACNLVIGGATFRYETLFYNHPVGVPKIRIYGPLKGELVFEDRALPMDTGMSQYIYAEAQKRAQANINLVHMYDKDNRNVYLGSKQVNEILDSTVAFTPIEPHTASCLFDVEKQEWVPVVFVIREDGSWENHPGMICQSCVIILTEEEYVDFPKPPTESHVWDFVKEEWKDTRNASQVASLAISNFAAVSHISVEPARDGDDLAKVSPLRHYMYVEELITEIKRFNLMPAAVKEKTLAECVDGQHYLFPHSSTIAKNTGMTLKAFFNSADVANLDHKNSGPAYAEFHKRYKQVVQNVNNPEILQQLEKESEAAVKEMLDPYDSMMP